MEKYEDVILAYKKAWELDPSMIFALHGKGICLDSLGKYDEAIVTYEEVIGLYQKILKQNPKYRETKENLQIIEENLRALKS